MNVLLVKLLLVKVLLCIYCFTSAAGLHLVLFGPLPDVIHQSSVVSFRFDVIQDLDA